MQINYLFFLIEFILSALPLIGTPNINDAFIILNEEFYGLLGIPLKQCEEMVTLLVVKDDENEMGTVEVDLQYLEIPEYPTTKILNKEEIHTVMQAAYKYFCLPEVSHEEYCLYVENLRWIYGNSGVNLFHSFISSFTSNNSIEEESKDENVLESFNHLSMAD